MSVQRLENRTSVIALSWFAHRRTTELCRGLRIDLHVLDTTRRGLTRYIELAFRTVRLIREIRPTVVLVQSPSIVLAGLALILSRPMKFSLVVDAHNEALRPVINARWPFPLISRWIVRNSPLTIVTNHQLSEFVTGVGGRPFVLQDRVPEVPDGNSLQLSPTFNVALIATFAEDEPIEAVFHATAGLQIQMFVTGNHMKLSEGIRNCAPSNVSFTGFLSEEKYWELLRSVDAVVDLSTMPDCLVCGAYEAIALSKPALLSESKASRFLFRDAALYTSNDAPSIRKSLETLRANASTMQRACGDTRARLDMLWNKAAEQLSIILNSLAGKSREPD